MHRLLLIVFIALVGHSSGCAGSQLRVNLVCPANGKGLEVDGQILHKALTELGCLVNWMEVSCSNHPAASDINIFCERLCPHIFPCGHFNWFIPNPECYDQELSLLDSIDLVLCRTQEVERIFRELGQPTFLLGFTTPDAQNVKIRKDFNAFIHVAGSSMHKGTYATAAAWHKNRHFPLLTILSARQPEQQPRRNVRWLTKKLPREDLKLLQNRCGIHVCLSETEGFGHYLMEAMSCGAVVITTDAAPMNEFIRDSRYLVPSRDSSRQRLATTHFVDSADIANKINEILSMPVSELSAAGAENRAAYIEIDRQFHANLKRLIDRAAVAAN